MEKDLSDMSLEELWALFPIVLKEHNPLYADWFEAEKQQLLGIEQADKFIRLNHIGSTAVPGLIAKPTVDILLEVDGATNLPELQQALEHNGWTHMYRQDDPYMKMAFGKGYSPNGYAEKVYHLHVRYHGDWDELYFRDYLIAYPNVADEYADLKKQLLAMYEHDRDAYTEAKSAFVQKYSNHAKMEYGEKYKP